MAVTRRHTQLAYVATWHPVETVQRRDALAVSRYSLDVSKGCTGQICEFVEDGNRHSAVRYC